MLPSFLLALREGVEAALIVGILLGALRKLKREEFSKSVWAGVLAAFAASVLAAVGLQVAGASFEGRAEESFEGTTMLLAAGLLTWMIFWMQRQSRSMRSKIEDEVRQASNSGGSWSLFGVAFLAVFREGIELALFLIAAGMTTGPEQSLAGAVVGLAAAVLLGWLIYSSTRRLPLHRFFQVTNILLILFAAGLVAHGVHEFNEAGLIPAVVEHVYDINPLLNEDSTTGQLLEALFGYNGNPSMTEVLAYLAYFAVLVLSLFRGQHQPGTTAVKLPTS